MASYLRVAWRLVFLGFLLTLLFLSDIVKTEQVSGIIILSYENRIEILNDSSSSHENFSLSPEVNYIVRVSADIQNKTIFVTDFRDPETKIFKVTFNDGDSYEISPVVVHKTLIYGLTYDPIGKHLYFSSSNRIYRCSPITSLTTAEVIYANDDSKIRDVAVDSCSDDPTIYWIDGSVIKVSSLRNKDVSVWANLTRPRGLVFDFRDRMLYWIDVQDDTKFTIQRSSTMEESSNNEVIYRGSGQLPFDLAVTDRDLYWSDWMNMIVWKIEKHGKLNEPIAAKRLSSSRPMGLTALSDSKCGTSYPKSSSSSYEESGYKVILEKTDPIMDERCLNYCIHGTCSLISNFDIPICHCDPGFGGSRCQNDLCHNFCLNGGICRFDLVGVRCDCQKRFNGSRCQIERSIDGVNSINMLWYGFISTSAITIALLILVAFLSLELCRRRRQRNNCQNSESSPIKIKADNSRKRIIVSRVQQSSKNHVDIEDCCQMTLCDTPCVDAVSFRKPRKRGCMDARKTQEEDDNHLVLLDNDSLVIDKYDDLF